MATLAITPALLKEYVKRFQVCWESRPEHLYVRGEKRQIGFVLELAGTHEAGVEHPEPGCEHCQRVFGALRNIAEWILPREKRLSEYDIGPYEPALRYSSTHHKRPDIILTIKIIHRNDFELPVDECQSRCLEEMEQRLTELGAGGR